MPVFNVQHSTVELPLMPTMALTAVMFVVCAQAEATTNVNSPQRSDLRAMVDEYELFPLYWPAFKYYPSPGTPTEY